MTLSTRAKEAIKVALAFSAVYGIALSMDWMNPYWAGFAVAMTALDTAGQSLNKGLLRVSGTIPGCIAALLIIAVAAQNPWLFLGLACAWVFFTSYMMQLDSKHMYFWRVAGFVCLVILISDVTTSQDMFTHAMYRSVENIMGVTVLTLINVFLWPQTQVGELKKCSAELIGAQSQRYKNIKSVVTGQSPQQALDKLHTDEVSATAKLGNILLGEGLESYEARQLRQSWEKIQQLSLDLMIVLDQWQCNYSEFSLISMDRVIVNHGKFFAEIDARFDAIPRILSGASPEFSPQAESFTLNRSAISDLAQIDKAALAVIKQQMTQLETITMEMFECAQVLAGQTEQPGHTPSAQKLPPLKKSTSLPVFDLDYLVGAGIVALAAAAGFLLWILFDPPGHKSWMELPAIIAMIVAITPQARIVDMLKPLSIAMLVLFAIYIFIMPALSGFSQLGALLFMVMFINRYFYAGMVQLLITIAILTILKVENQQIYDFAAQANSILFTVGAFAFAYIVSYAARSPRPEKAVFKQLKRFFRSAEFLTTTIVSEKLQKPSLLTRWKFKFYRYEMSTLPAKIGSWGNAIDHSYFNNNSPELVTSLKNNLQILAYRIDTLLEARDSSLSKELIAQLHNELQDWRSKIGDKFAQLTNYPGTDMMNSDAEVNKSLDAIELRITSILATPESKAITDKNLFDCYRLMGCYRGLFEAMTNYAAVSQTIDWAQWQEERFS